MKTVLDKLINKDQTGFIKGTFIGENIRLMYEIMHFPEQNNIPGLIMLIYFEKAFNTISWKEVLKFSLLYFL